MNESEFRDWTRRAQAAFDQRLKALEAKFGALTLASPRVREAEVLANVKELSDKVSEVVRTGKVTALAVAFLVEDDGPWTGFAHEKWERYALAGTAGQLWIELLHKPVNENGESHEQEHGGEVGTGVPHPGGES